MAITVLHTPLTVSLTGTKVPVKLSTDLTGSEKTFLSIHLKVQKYDGSSWVDVGHDSKLVDSNNEAVFYIEDYLKLQTTPEFSYPEHETNILIDRPEMLFRYRIAYYESYYDTSTDTLTTTSETQDTTDYYALDGGLDKQAEAAYNDSNTDWLEQLGNRFLTWQPDEKNVHTDFIDKLYWLVQSVSTVKLKARKTASDGSTSEAVKDDLSVSAHTVVEICVSPELLFSDLSDAEKIEIWLLDGSNNAISETRTYNIDHSYYQRDDTFAFVNSFGVFDFIWARGNMKETLSFERNTFKRSLQYNQFMKDHSNDQSRALKTNEGESEIGYITEADPVAWKQYYAEEFLASKKYYKLESTQVIPIVMDSEESLLFKDKQYIHSQPFSWRRSHTNRFFSREAIQLDNILTPYYSELDVALFRKHMNIVKSLRGEYHATLSGSDIIFPQIYWNDIFDFSATMYWDSTITNESWYDFLNVRTTLQSNLTAEFLADFATQTTHNRLFFHDIENSDIKKALPILVYSRDMTDAEQKVIVNWLDWYFYIQENGSFITEDGNYIKEKY